MNTHNAHEKARMSLSTKVIILLGITNAVLIALSLTTPIPN